MTDRTDATHTNNHNRGWEGGLTPLFLLLCAAVLLWVIAWRWLIATIAMELCKVDSSSELRRAAMATRRTVTSLLFKGESCVRHPKASPEELVR
jgi:hypothetical protein